MTCSNGSFCGLFLALIVALVLGIQHDNDGDKSNVSLVYFTTNSYSLFSNLFRASVRGSSKAGVLICSPRATCVQS